MLKWILNQRRYSVVRYHKGTGRETPMVYRFRFWTVSRALRRKEQLEHSLLGSAYWFEVSQR